MTRPPHRTKRMQGYTLLEIMIALALGAFVIAGIFQVLLSFKITEGVSEGLSRVQEAGRSAISMVSRDLRLAGQLGCADPSVTNVIRVIADSAPSLNPVADAVRGFEADSAGWGAATSDLDTIDGSGNGNALLNSDVISVLFASEESISVSAHSDSGGTITIGSNELDFKAQDLAILGDCNSLVLFAIKGVTAAGSNFSVTYDDTGNVNKLMRQTYSGEQARLMQLRSHTYFISETGRTTLAGSPIHALYRRDARGAVDEIIEGVEQLQIQYGERLSSGAIRYISSDKITNNADIEAVKLSLLVASNNATLEADDTRLYRVGALDIGPNGSGADLTYDNDRRLRKVFDATINIRNRMFDEDN